MKQLAYIMKFYEFPLNSTDKFYTMEYNGWCSAP